jgi:hypothetical protein
MKKTLLVLSLALGSVAIGSRGLQPTDRGLKATATSVCSTISPDCYTFTVDNASSDSLGTVRVNGLASYQDFNVDTTGFYEHDLCFAAVSATVNGVAIDYPNSGNVQLASGAWVTVAWQSSSLIEIADEKETNGPTRQ